jgi:hypothetical protein
MRARTLCLIAMVCLAGCSGKKGGGGGAGSGISLGGDGGAVTSRECMDQDGDGFGKYCMAGPDCNDNDPAITNECVLCKTPNKGCPCVAGTMPMRCDPHYMMKTTKNGVTGTLTCSEGTRYCRDSVYSDCEVLLQYATFVADH